MVGETRLTRDRTRAGALADARRHNLVITGEHLIGGVGQLPARDFLGVSVPEVCVEAAAPVVHEMVAMLRAPVAEAHEDAPAPVPGLRPAST